jgi:hypothetical protein
MTQPMRHERARRLAAGRLDQALQAADEVALEAHLADCASCRASVAGYEADRLALRVLPPIEPPRDLWARLSVALEREHARRPRVVRRTPRRWGPVAVLGSGFALILVLAMVGPTLLGTSPADLGVATSGGGAGLAASSAPIVTPLTVPTSEVTWVVMKGSGGLSLVTARVNKVCPAGDEPDCAPLAGISRSLASLPTVPSSLVLSPSNASQAVAIAPAPNQVGTTLFVMAVPAIAESSSGLGSSPLASAGASAGPAISPVPGSESPATAVPTPAETRPAATPTPSASSAQVGSASPPPMSPALIGSPAPTAAASLAIMSHVTLVGDEAAYSPDGLWFAFSARPAGTSTGPDVYVWQAGWPTAQPITADHGSVFSGWVDGQILVSRAIPVEVDGSAAPASPGDSAFAPAAAPGSLTGPPPSAAASLGPSADTSALPQASPSGSPALATPAAFLIDPASGQATRIVGLDGWRPVVDPSGTWVAYWAGTLVFDPASGMWDPFQGQLQVASWSTVSTAVDGPTGAAAAHSLPLGAVTDWDLRWDLSGEHLGVWIADANNPGLGQLSLLTIDPQTGQLSSTSPGLLTDTPALRGFALRDGQLVWATPPGQDGNGSRLSVLAWIGANAGKTSIQSIDSGALIVVP